MLQPSASITIPRLLHCFMIHLLCAHYDSCTPDDTDNPPVLVFCIFQGVIVINDNPIFNIQQCTIVHKSNFNFVIHLLLHTRCYLLRKVPRTCLCLFHTLRLLSMAVLKGTPCLNNSLQCSRISIANMTLSQMLKSTFKSMQIKKYLI